MDRKCSACLPCCATTLGKELLAWRSEQREDNVALRGARIIVGERQLHERRAAADGAAHGGHRVVLQDDRVQVG